MPGPGPLKPCVKFWQQILSSLVYVSVMRVANVHEESCLRPLTVHCFPLTWVRYPFAALIIQLSLGYGTLSPGQMELQVDAS